MLESEVHFHGLWTGAGLVVAVALLLVATKASHPVYWVLFTGALLGLGAALFPFLMGIPVFHVEIDDYGEYMDYLEANRGLFLAWSVLRMATQILWLVGFVGLALHLRSQGKGGISSHRGMVGSVGDHHG